MSPADCLKFCLAADADLPGIVSLWQACFHDDEAAIRRFFDSILLREHVIIAKIGDTVVAHAAAVPVTLRLGGACRAGVYVYAACVAPEHRGAGIFRRLMDHVDRYVIERGLDFIMLIPATTALFETYRRFGYRHEIGGLGPVGGDGRFGLALSPDELAGLSLCDFDGDYDMLYTLHRQSGKAGFVKPRGFFEYTLREIAPYVNISLIPGPEGQPAGYMVSAPAVLTNGKKILNILQIDFPDTTNNDIITSIRKKAVPHPKALCKLARGGDEYRFRDILVDLFGEF